MKFAVAILFAALAASASAQVINTTAVESLLSGYTGGINGLPSDTYLTSLASTLASGFVSAVDDVVSNVTEFIKDPSSYEDVLEKLEDKLCDPAELTESEKMPASIKGPEIDIIFSGGACLLNETDFLAGNGSLAVDCIAPSVTIDILPASLTSKYTSAVEFTDKECKIQKEFGKETDQVIFVLDKGIFNQSALVDTLQTGLTSVLGEFSSLTGGIVAAPTISPILTAVNTATSLLG